MSSEAYPKGSTSPEAYPQYRWVVLLLLLAALMAQPFNNYGVSALYRPIQEGMGLSHTQMGLLSTILGLCMALFALTGGAIMANIGIKLQYTIALGLMAIGGIALGFAPNFGLMLIARLVTGIGFGMMYPVKTAVVMKWFPSRERLLMNAVTLASAYAGFFFLFKWIFGIFALVGNDFRKTLIAIGFIAAIALVLWVIFYKDDYEGLPSEAFKGEKSKEKKGFDLTLLKEVAINKYIIYMTLGIVFHYFASEAVGTFLPAYLTEKFGDPALANGIMAYLPGAGTIAIVAAAIIAPPLKNRKLFIWPFMVLYLLGAIGVMLSDTPGTIKIFQIVVGASSAAFYPAFTTLCMELPGFNPMKVGVAMGFIFGLGNLSKFVTGVVTGALADSFGLFAGILGMVIVAQLLATFFMLKLPESHGKPMIKYEE